MTITKNTPAPSEAYRVQLCHCFVDKFESIYPNGLPANIPDSVTKKVSHECYTTLLNSSTLKSLLQDTLRATLLRQPSVNNLPPKGKADFCNCVIKELDTKYPNTRLNDIPKEAFSEIFKECPLSKYNY